MKAITEDLFNKFKKQYQDKPGWLKKLQDQSFQNFQKIGLPTPQNENWKFTGLAPIAEGSFELPEKLKFNGELKELFKGGFFSSDVHRIVFINGAFSKEHSSLGSVPSGVIAGNWLEFLRTSGERLKDILEKQSGHCSDNAFYSLNTAFCFDAAVLFLPEGTHLEGPVHFIFVSISNGQTFFACPRVLVIAEKNSQANIVESYFGLGENVSFNNAVTEIFLGENAVLDYVRLQNEGKNTFHISNTIAVQDKNSSFTSHAVSLSGSLIRNDLQCNLNGEGAECGLNGFYLVQGKNHVDNHTTIEHLKPHCRSRELYKGILSENSKAVFNGRIVVQPNAQKTDALQYNRNLLLSEDALVYSKPELKIFANDVKCKHGATVGQMDQSAMFYLRSRGLGEKQAREMLVHAFVNEVVGKIAEQQIQEHVKERLRAVC